MRKFFSVWLILLVIIAFAIVLLVSYPILTAQAERTASADLNVLLDAAFTRISLAKDSAEAVADASNDNVLSKARAVDRFLSHDDALLATDALISLCELLNVSSIDVTDMDGAIIASSTEARIGRNLVDDRSTAWTKEVLEGENLSRTFVDENNAALLSGCVSRTDTEGLIVIQSLDVAIMEAMNAASPAQVLLDMSFIKDTLAVPDAEGDLGLSADDAYIVTRTQDGVALSAARPLSQVYAERSAVLFVEAIGFLLLMVFAIVIQFLLIKKRLSSRTATALSAGDAETDAIVAAEMAEHADLSGSGDLPEGMPDRDDDDAVFDETPQDTHKRAARRARKPRQKIFEFVDLDEEESVLTDEAATGAPSDTGETDETEADERAPQRPFGRKRRKRVRKDAPEAEEAAEVTDEAAEAFSAPQAVIEEPAEEEAMQPRRRKKRAAPAAEAAEAATEAFSEAADKVAKPARTQKPRRKKQPEAPVDSDGAFDKIFD